jgi:hypothetical protein
MKAEAMNLLQWQERFGTEEACAEALNNCAGPMAFSAQNVAMIRGTGSVAARSTMRTLSIPEFSDCRNALPFQ